MIKTESHGRVSMSWYYIFMIFCFCFCRICERKNWRKNKGKKCHDTASSLYQRPEFCCHHHCRVRGIMVAAPYYHVTIMNNIRQYTIDLHPLLPDLAPSPIPPPSSLSFLQLPVVMTWNRFSTCPCRSRVFTCTSTAVISHLSQSAAQSDASKSADYIYIYTYICMWYMYTHTYIHVYVYIYLFSARYVYTYICISKVLTIYIHIYTYICILAYHDIITHTHTHAHTRTHTNMYMHIAQRTGGRSTKQPNIPPKEPYILPKEPCVLPKESEYKCYLARTHKALPQPTV